ncbi:MAG TPA: hypothetical protein VJP45_07695 [Candidatus Limnocylindria bacterium]|nr:hypothetical protein [Candidatus Limnocylindria bacterium]
MVFSAVLLGACANADAPQGGLQASASASGAAKMVAGDRPYDLARAQDASGRIDVETTDGGNRWSHLQNRDIVRITAEFTQGSDRFKVLIDKPMPRHPHGSYTTWSGVAYEVSQHGRTGIGTSELPRMTPEISAWGYAEVSVNDRVVAKDAPAHVMVTAEGDMRGITLDVAGEDRSLMGVRDGYLVVHWPEVGAIRMPEEQERNRELLGWAVLLGLVIFFGWLAMNEPVRPMVRSARLG